MKKYLLMYVFILAWLAAFPFVINKAVNGTFSFAGEETGGLTGIDEPARTSKPETAISCSYADEPTEPEERETLENPDHDPFEELKTAGNVITLFDNETKKETDVSAEYYTAFAVTSVCSDNDITLSAEAMKAFCIAVRTKAVYENDAKGKMTLDSIGFLYRTVNDDTANAVLDAVKATKGEVITYESKVINALYHLSSPGKTESYKNLYSREIPYLTGVFSPDESSFPHYYGRKEVSAEEFRRIMESAFVNIKLTGDHSEWITDFSFDNCLRCRYLEIGDEKISGTSFMKVFGLNSTCIMISTSGDGFIFSTEGYGHGLGLSVWGAEMLSEQGKDHVEILKHYYKSAAIAALS
ncbi:MAG: SpoIID/LytB domain-containing protein [Clostridia bacterium]|nr:SpoIID/LytB domain-containing protein [Clostridia bacterium]